MTSPNPRREVRPIPLQAGEEVGGLVATFQGDNVTLIHRFPAMSGQPAVPVAAVRGET